MRGLFLFLVLLASTGVHSQKQIFDRIGKKDGLPDNNIWSIAQDGYGHLWFGTSNGLALYNGYSFRTWRHIQEDSNSLPHNQVEFLLTTPHEELFVGHINKGFYKFNYHKEIFEKVDRTQNDPDKKWLCAYYSQHGKIWVGSSDGLEYYDAKAAVLRKVKLGIPGDYFISSISEDDKGCLWLFSSCNRIVKYHPESGDTQVIPYGTVVHKNFLMRGGKVLYDHNGYVWIGTEHEGLYRYNFISKTINHFCVANGKLKSNIILSLLKDKKGMVWIGTDAGGLYQFVHPADDTPRQYVTDVESEESISSNTIYSIFEVEPELLLVGTFAGGLNVVNEFRHKFVSYSDKGLPNTCLSNKSVLSFSPAANGKIWIGTDGGGLNLFDPKTHRYEYWNLDNGKLPHSNVAKSTFVDSQGRLWVGSYAGGVAVLDPKGRMLKVFKDEDNPNSIGSDHVWRIVEDEDHYMWLGLLNNGAERISPDLKTIEHYTFDVPGNSGFRSPEVLMMVKDAKGTIWAISESLHYFDPSHKKFVEYTFPGMELPSNIRDLCVDKAGNLWVGTSDAAFYKVPADKSQPPVVYPSSKGWYGNAVISIQDDEYGNIWMATDVGISCLKNGNSYAGFLNFDMHDGVQTGQFNSGAKMRDSEGYIYFGGSEGYHRFHPKNVKLNYHLPKVSISDIRIFNQPLSSYAKYNKAESVFWNDSTVYFHYSDKMISIEFAGLDFVLPEKNRFAYKLDGFDHDWNYSRFGTHLATYTNLDPGTYTFKVKAANNDGQWNNESSKLHIVILPPWWGTWWFRTIMAIAFVAGLLGFYFWRTRSIRRRNLELHQEVAAQTNELRQINEELQQTSEEVTRQNNEIVMLYNELTESIQAAHVIQNAILPERELLEEYFGKLEIFYKPKDVVSGDFYWCAKNGNRHLLAMVDCTGHGVAGAFMTFIGYETLNQILRENIDASAGDILTLLNQEIITSMNRNKSEKVNAGMDVALCIYDKATQTLEFAGANNPLYLIRKEELIVYKGDKQGVGGKQKTEDYQFQTNHIPLEKGDQLYIFSDGYADQLGGLTGTEKFMYPRFRQTLMNLKGLPIQTRMAMVEEEFETWRNGHEQLDDVLVIGFEI